MVWGWVILGYGVCCYFEGVKVVLVYFGLSWWRLG
jgi:hypothetical protein